MSARLKLKVFAVFLSTIYYLLSTALISPVSAQQITPIQPSTIQANQTMTNLIHILSCLGVGQSPIGQPCFQDTFIKNLSINNSNPYVSNLNTSNGLLGAAGSVLGIILSQPPINTYEYLADTANGFGITPKVNAQVGGSGSNVLNPILTLWQVSRNFAYIIMILIFITIGLMVMFRHKINPQTVVTVQSALPGLIIGLVLITFSYFAAALITDMAFVGTDLVGYYFNAATGKEGSLLQQLKDENAVSIGSSFVGRLSGTGLPGSGPGDIESVANIIIKNLESPSNTKNAHPVMNAQNIVKITIAVIAYPVGFTLGRTFGSLVETFFPGFGKVGWIAKILGAKNANQGEATARLKALEASGWSGAIVGALFALVAYFNPGFAIGFAFYLIAIFAVLYAVFRLLLALINTYLSVIFLTITAPFHFLVSSIPGRQGVAINWARNMLASILTFPAVIAVFYFAAFLIGDNKISAFQLGQRLEITGSSGALPLFGGFDMSFVRMLLAIGAVLATPKIPEIISKSIGKPGNAGGLIDQGINQAIGQGQKYSSQTSSGAGKISSNIKEDYNKWRGQDPYPMKSQEAQLLRTATGRGKLPEWLSPRDWTSTLRDTGAQSEYLRKMYQGTPEYRAALRLHLWENGTEEQKRNLPDYSGTDYQNDPVGYQKDKAYLDSLGPQKSSVLRFAASGVNAIRSGNTGIDPMNPPVPPKP